MFISIDKNILFIVVANTYKKIANQPKILRIVNLGALARKLSHLTYDGKEYIKLRGNQDALLLLEINVFFNCGKENDGLSFLKIAMQNDNK